ncbi:MAG: hypothetical protein EPN26_16450 [Rhodospirillales bacterium]|nr:MAG: hypothetical protein EPN26_16450 [Rhodospirillales bacterium]
MKWRNIFLFLPILAVTACVLQPPPSDLVWVPGEKRYISQSEALERLAKAPVVLLGESHDNAGHHRLQAFVVAELAARGQKRALAIEMIDRDRQGKVEDIQSLRPAKADGFRTSLDWDKSGWPDFAIYAPVFQAGLDAGWPIRAANLPKSLMKGAGKPGGLEAAEETLLGLHLSLPPGASEDLKQELIDGHCGLLPESSLPAMMRIQIARDGAMAQTLLENPPKDGAVLIAGAGHVRTDRAVPFHIASLRPGLKVMSLAFREQTVPPSPPESESWPYDLVWFTPAQPEVDHCAGLKKTLEKKGK